MKPINTQKNKQKRGRKFMHIALIILCIIVGLNILGFIINKTFFRNELESIQPYGQLVDVNGGKMHVYSMGSGEKTIVLLPGFGVSLPSADFGPLMRKLSESYTVVTIEYFGIGFSDKTDKPRTNENYMNEIRTALAHAGFNPPYILMPHSASGVYSEYYAIQHPEEVSSIIMLDTTSTAVTGENPGYMGLLYSVGKIQQATGFTRIVTGLVPDTKLVENGYTEKEIADYKTFTYHVLNDTLIDQSLLLIENINEVNGMVFPEDIPVLKIISKQSIEVMAKKDKDDGMGYQNRHLSMLGNKVAHAVVDSTHFVYQTHFDQIVEMTDAFLDQNK
ncbi:MAG TPA: alpha/beta hydrolase [Clostridiales bacterium]|jgi:pimeloyl-ACP methyl ester carboxylesterase|nr:alpha/beta hydrolase [Clostridiales bacterium]